MNDTNPLQNLKDIHLPTEVPFWPPAPGWWILALLILSLIIWVGWTLRKKYQQKHLLRLSLRALTQLEQDYAQHQNAQLLIRQYSELLKRVALVRFSRPEVASLSGAAWLNFLDQSAQKKLFNTPAGQILINAPYQKPDSHIENTEALSEIIKLWFMAINSNKLQRPIPDVERTDSEVSQS